MREYFNSGADEIRSQVLTQKSPAVLRGLVSHWPAVRAAARGPLDLIAYLERFASDVPVDALLTPPEVRGRISYNRDMTGFNFLRNRVPLLQVAEQALRYAKFPEPPAVAAQSAAISDCLPGFAADNLLEVVGPDVQPRIWLGGRITTPAHVDEWNNIACVVTGRRRFTLFAPEQVENLYIGPLDFAPTGAPMSLASLHEPDFERFPRLRLALAAAQRVELQPGDALFIPPLWWHHVESLEPFNVLVNYWWHESQGDGARADSAFESLLHAILSIRSLPKETRAAWAALFNRYVFGEADLSHIPKERLGLLGELDETARRALKAHLAKRLSP